MMKANYKLRSAIILILSCAFFSGCKKTFLEVSPKGKLIAEKVVDYDQLLSNTDLVTVDANAQAPMGDEVAAIEPYFGSTDLRTQRLFRWDNVIYQPDENAAEMVGPMKHIYLYNKVINEVMTATDGTEQQKLSIQSEAMAGRAWTYFLLINYYGKPFNPATSATDPGFPLVTEADVTQHKFERSTVKQVYDFIIKDLTTAIPHLPVKTSYRVRMSKAAAEGILAKVYIFMGEYDKALPLLNSALAEIPNAAIPVRLYDYNTNFSEGGAFYPMLFVGPNYPTFDNNQEIVYAKYSGNDWTLFNNELVLSKEAQALFDPSDLRLNFYSGNIFAGPAYPNGFLRKTFPAGIYNGVMVPELILLRAECRARLKDLAGAVSDLENLRVKRMPAANAPVPALIASQQLSLLKFIMEERVREFALLGFRWFDMRRMSVDPLFNKSTYTHTLYSEEGLATKTFTLKPERLVMQFPQKLMDENPNMQNNP